jgi:two-component system LytT family response regulator
MKIRTLIVDDMNLARERIKMILDADDEIDVIAECTNGREAVAAIKNLNPELVFLDVQMPQMSGFDVVRTIGVDQMPTTIFVTAYDEFALRAFEVNALDYLLKPFDEERLEKAVKRAKREIKKLESSSTTTNSSSIDERLIQLLNNVKIEPKYLKRIPVKSAKQTILLPTDDIDWIAAAGNYLELYAGKNMHLIRERLTHLEQKLDPEKFARIHRSTIVNIEHIKTLQPLFNGDHLIILQNGKELHMSRTFREKLFSLLDS